MCLTSLKRLLLVSVAAVATPATHAGDGIPVVELFTSQGCYSCPAADRLLGELIHGPSPVIGLEFHVDYWDDLVYGRAGRWKDPFSSADHTARQRRYHDRRLRGRRGVYTPQAVINGRHVIVGSDRSAMTAALRQSGGYSVAVDIERSREDTLRVMVDGSEPRTAGIWLLRFDHRRVTPVPAGENHGKTLANHNIVRTLERIGDWAGRRQTIVVDPLALGEDQGCAILVQEDGGGPIVGAALC